MDVPISKALILYTPPRNDLPAAFAIRPLGHPDYDKFAFKVGACFRTWQEDADPERLKLRLLIDVWHAVAFYDIPPKLAHEALLVIPEYRDMLADDCLPRKFWSERDM